MIAGVALMFAVLIFVSAPAYARMSDVEAEGHLWGDKGKPDGDTVVLQHPSVIRVEVESAHVSINPDVITKKATTPRFLAKVTYRVVTTGLLAAAEVEALAAHVREQADRFHVVGVRFTQDRPSASGNPFYAWLLFWDGRDTVRNIMTTPEAQEDLVGTLHASLIDGESVIGVWEDVNAFPGVVALTVQSNRLWLRQIFSDGSGGDTRYRLKETLRGKRWVALYVRGPYGSFKADGSGTKRLSVELRGPKLIMTEGDEREASFLGEPIGVRVQAKDVPQGEPKTGAVRKSNARLKSVRDALDCATRTSGPCFSRADVIAIGKADSAAGSAAASCKFETTSGAKQLVDAALLTAEDALMDGWASWYDSEDSRNAPARGSAKASAFCEGLFRRLGPDGSELAGFISNPE